MYHESIKKSLEISDTDITFDQIYKKDYVPAEYLNDIKAANLLIIPNENFRDNGDILFPETTRELFDFIKESSGEKIVADITISDEDFQRIELHSAVIPVAMIIVQWVILPVATSLVANFLYGLVKKYHRKPEETSTTVKIIVEKSETKRNKMITYEGPVSGIKDALDQATKDLFSGE